MGDLCCTIVRGLIIQGSCGLSFHSYKHGTPSVSCLLFGTCLVRFRMGHGWTIASTERTSKSKTAETVAGRLMMLPTLFHRVAIGRHVVKSRRFRLPHWKTWQRDDRWAPSWVGECFTVLVLICWGLIYSNNVESASVVGFWIYRLAVGFILQLFARSATPSSG